MMVSMQRSLTVPGASVVVHFITRLTERRIQI